jgi:ubiquinone/menaquinone biosynthesis C-methylase UbiE
MNTVAHNANIVEQFSKQAIPFTKMPGHLDAIEMLMEMADLRREDTVLDIACGPGLVLCEFAKIATEATGIDITENMLTLAKKRQANLKLNNMKWDLGNVTELPYPSNSFSLVITRYSFHHFQEPGKALTEMVRVCKPGGRILVADVILPKEKVKHYDEVETLRDDSHAGALTFEAIEDLLSIHNLKNLKQASYKLHMELDKQIAASFPKPGDDEKIRTLFKNDLKDNKLGMDARLVEGVIHFSYPVSIYVGEK